jgi:hypothetical protein
MGAEGQVAGWLRGASWLPARLRPGCYPTRLKERWGPIPIPAIEPGAGGVIRLRGYG